MKWMLIAALFFTPASAYAAYDRGSYSGLISRHCRAVERVPESRYINPPIHMPASTIQIRKVRNLSGGWLRIYGMGNAFGRNVQGHMDYHPASGRVNCPDGNWFYGPYLPVWPMLKNQLNIR